MEFEFDKEMDFLLRQTARSKSASAESLQSAHLDADEIAAFAENALPEKARLNRVAHLADCDRCRKILSNLIALNAESPGEMVHADEARKLSTDLAPEIPWYRRLFAVPTLAYAMGALVLLFAGIGVFTVLQNDSMSSQISQVPEKQIGGSKGMSSDGDAAEQENQTSAVSNTATSSATSANTTANAANSASLNAPSAPSAMNANATTARRAEIEPTDAANDDRREDDSFAADSKLAENKEIPGSAAPPTAAPAPPPSTAKTEDADKRPPPPAAEAEAEEDREPNPPKSSVTRAAPSAKMRRADDLKKKSDAPETATVGGKNFKRANNIWIDAAYRGQTTTNISRGTNEYKNLDSGLRGIVENLGGTVIVVWKEKAFRIQ